MNLDLILKKLKKLLRESADDFDLIKNSLFIHISQAPPTPRYRHVRYLPAVAARVQIDRPQAAITESRMY